VRQILTEKEICFSPLITAGSVRHFQKKIHSDFISCGNLWRDQGKFLFICWREPTGFKNSKNLKLLKTIKFHNQLQTKIPEPNFGTLPQNTDPNLQQQPTHIQTLSEDSAAKIISLGKTCFLLGCGYCFLLRVTDSVVNKNVVVYDAYRLYYASCLSFYLYRTYTKNPKMDVGRDFPPIVRGRTLVLPPQYQM
jgi:hypothetical protein